MNCYETLTIDEKTPVQYVGVYVMHWKPEWGEPEVAFRESVVADDLLAAAKAALALLCGTGQDGTLGHHPDNPVPSQLRVAIAKGEER